MGTLLRTLKIRSQIKKRRKNMPPKASGKAAKKAGKAQKAISKGERRKQQPQAQGVLCHLHLQSLEASPSRHWRFFQGHEHHELVCQRHLRKDCRRSIQIGSLQQKIHHHLPRNPNSRPSSSAWSIGKASSF